MASRTDQLQAYQFMTQRVISALVMRETDPRQSPLRRGVGAVFGGLMVAILVAAGFGIFGILTKVGSDGWKSNGAVVIEKESGASFVYLNGTLYPTLNLTSAMLASGQANPPVFRVASGSLGVAPRGNTVGIPGAPASLPTAAKRVGLPWSVCALAGADGKTSTVALAVSLAPDGGRSLVNEGVLVKDAKSGTTYLIWHSWRHLVQSSKTLVPALFGAATAVPVGTAWLNTLSPGGDIRPITISQAGNASAAVKGRKVGDMLLAQTGSGPQYYLVFNDGLAPITELQRFILDATSPVKPIQVDLSEINGAPRSTRLNPVDGLQQPPATAPPLVRPDGGEQLCAVTNTASSPPTVWLGGTVAGLDRATPTTSSSGDGAVLADQILVPAGRVAVVRVLGGPDAQSGPYFIVTDLGIKYPVSAEPVLAMLGYAPAQAIDVPSSLMARIPTGPTLDPAAAVVPAKVTK
jgi:type VII secretion protein EccB